MVSILAELETNREQGQPAARFLQALVDRWLLLATLPLAIALAILAYQALKKPVHAIQSTVAPTREAVSGLDSQLGNLSRLAAVAGVSVGKGETAVGDFEKFRFLIFSTRLGDFQVANRDILPLVFPKQWDGTGWKRPDGLTQKIKDGLYPLFGLEPWVAPDGRTLAGHYNEQLSISEVGETGLFRVRLLDTDRERGEKLLNWLIKDANELVRRDAAERASARAAYLRQQIQTSAVIEYRENLATMLAKEEQTLMLASTSLPFAAEVIQPVTSGHNPASQRPVLYAALGGAIGFAFAIFLALLLGPKRESL